MSLPVTPQVWLDAADGATITADTQNNVTSWASKGTIGSVAATPTGPTTRTFNLASNGGFTAAFRARHTGVDSESSYERIFDFGSGAEVNNIICGRFSTTKNLAFWIMVPGSRVINQFQLTDAIDGNYHNYIIRADGNTRTAKWYKDSATTESATYAFVAGLSLTDRTLSNCFIGQSNYAGEAYLNGDITALYMFDRCITDEEMVIVHNHMLNLTPTPLPIYNAKVAINAALYNATSGTAIAAIEGFGQGTAGNRPTFLSDSGVPRINFNRANSQFMSQIAPVVKTARITQNGRNCVLCPPESTLVTSSSFSFGNTSRRSVFAVARNLTEVNARSTPLPTWTGVRFIRVERTDSVATAINIAEIELYDASGRRIGNAGITASLSPPYNASNVNEYPASWVLNNSINRSGIIEIASTSASASAFIQLDLGIDRTLSKIIIRNRYDTGQGNMVGTTLRIQNASASNIQSIAIGIALNSYIFTPSSVVTGAGKSGTYLFSSANNVVGGVSASLTDYRSLNLFVYGTNDPNLNTTTSINDTEVAVFSLVNDSAVLNAARVNGSSQLLNFSNSTAYSTTASLHYINGINVTLSPNSTLQLCELLVYDSSLTLAQITAIETYLSDKWIVNPYSIPRPKVWLDAADSSTFIADSQNNVGVIYNKGVTEAIAMAPPRGGPITFDIEANMGFTIAIRIRFTGGGTFPGERIFDFGDGRVTNNLLLVPWTSGSFLFQAYNAGSAAVSIAMPVNNMYTPDVFESFIFRFNDSAKTYQVYKNGAIIVNTTAYTGTFPSRTPAICYVGRSNWDETPLNADISALYILDRYITDTEVSTINTHMTNGTATQLVIPNLKVSINAALIDSRFAGQAFPSIGDFAAINGPVFNTSPARIEIRRANTQYLVNAGGGSRTILAGSNGGFTAAFRVKFTGTAGNSERIFDFGSAQAFDNIFITRVGTSNQLLFRVYWKSGVIIDVYTSTNSIADTNFHNYVFRLNENPISGLRTAQVYKDGVLDTSNTTSYTTGFVNRVVAICYIGRSHWTGDDYFNGEISALYVFDRCITDDEMATINTHMTNHTATQLPVYNAKVALNAALLNLTAGSAVASCDDFAQATAGNRPTFQTGPARIVFNRTNLQHLQATNPAPKTSRIQYYGKNTFYLPAETALVTNALALTGSATSRSVFAVARNLTEVTGTPNTTWSNVRYIRLQRTNGVSTALNTAEIEVFDSTGAKISNSTITPFQDTTLVNPPNDFSASQLINNAIRTNAAFEIAQTQASTTTYQQLDLGAEKTISKVIIRNRYDAAKDRIIGTTLTLRRADNETIVASQVINIGPDSLIFTPSSFTASRYQNTQLFTSQTTTSGTLAANFTDYRALALTPIGSITPNVDSAMIPDPQPNVLTLINDGTVGNSVRINGTAQTIYYNTSTAFSTTNQAQYCINEASTTEANSALQLCELLVYDTPLTSAQISTIQAYLIAKWHYTITPPIPNPVRPFTYDRSINYWWRFTDPTKQGNVVLTLTGGPGASTVTTNALAEQYTFTGLTNGATYNCTITAIGEDGQTTSTAAYRETQSGGKPSIPLNVSFSQPTTNSLYVTWSTPAPDADSSTIGWYVLQSTDKQLRYGIEPFRREFLVTGIQAGTRAFQLQAINYAGYGDPAISPTYTFS